MSSREIFVAYRRNMDIAIRFRHLDIKDQRQAIRDIEDNTHKLINQLVEVSSIDDNTTRLSRCKCGHLKLLHRFEFLDCVNCRKCKGFSVKRQSEREVKS